MINKLMNYKTGGEMTKVYVVKDLDCNCYYHSNLGWLEIDGSVQYAQLYTDKQEAIDKINELEIPYTVIEEVYI